jgi:hypothetical protein
MLCAFCHSLTVSGENASATGMQDAAESCCAHRVTVIRESFCQQLDEVKRGEEVRGFLKLTVVLFLNKLF